MAVTHPLPERRPGREHAVVQDGVGAGRRDQGRHKYLLLTSDDTLSTEDVARGYKQLLEIERAWRCLKSELDIRPMYHRLDQRIRAHVLVCWLALLLVRVVEVETGSTWARVQRSLDRIHRGEFRTPVGRVVQRTELRPEHRALFSACGVKPPPKFEAIDPA